MKSFTAALIVLALALVGAHAVSPFWQQLKSRSPAEPDSKAIEAAPSYGAYSAKETSNASPGFDYVPKSGAELDSEAIEATPSYGAYSAKETSNASPGFDYVPSGAELDSEPVAIEATAPYGAYSAKETSNASPGFDYVPSGAELDSEPVAIEATASYEAYSAKETSNASPGLTYVPKSGCSYSSETKPEGNVITENCAKGLYVNTITLKDGHFVGKDDCAYASVGYASEHLTVFLEYCGDKKAATPYLLESAKD